MLLFLKWWACCLMPTILFYSTTKDKYTHYKHLVAPANFQEMIFLPVSSRCKVTILKIAQSISSHSHPNVMFPSFISFCIKSICTWPRYMIEIYPSPVTIPCVEIMQKRASSIWFDKTFIIHELILWQLFSVWQRKGFFCCWILLFYIKFAVTPLVVPEKACR